LLSLNVADDRMVEGEVVADVLKNTFAGGQSSPGWQQLADEAEFHGVAPLIEPMISAVPGHLVPGMPDTLPRTFVVLARRHRRAALARETCIDRLLEAFDAASIPMLLLKGAALAHSLYPRPDLRPMADVDILIRPEHSAAATRVAQSLGYEFASGYGTRFAVSHHHLPVASTIEAGFRISLEIHQNTMSFDQSDTLDFSSLTAPPRVVHRAFGCDGLTLGHIDMLRHLARHAFEPAPRIRLIHLLDLWRYQARYSEEIDWRDLDRRFPHVIVALRLTQNILDSNHVLTGQFGPILCAAPERPGMGMIPLSEIAASRSGTLARLDALFNPSPWWLHGFYGVPPENSLWACRTFRHPATLARWLTRRLLARVGWLIRAFRDEHRLADRNANLETR
jgi:hypothetical protein